MENRTEGELSQTQKTEQFNSKLWIRVVCIVLSVAMVAIVCLGVALFSSNNKIAALQADLNRTNESLDALNEENKAAASEIDALQSDLELTDEEVETLKAELDEALKQAQENQESLEGSLDALEKTNQSAKDEINRLNGEMESAMDEIDRLNGDIESAKGEIASLKEQIKEQPEEPEDKIRIYIDQGHNPSPYHNSGATGNGLCEQDVTFLIGCLLADLLRTDNRFEVQLSRPNKSVVLGTDNKSSLMARVEGAAAFEADYLISLHTNSFDQESVNGIEIYVEEETGESYVFAESLLGGLIASTNLKDRGRKLNPDLDILEYSAMPAVLVEMGFISNGTDAALLSEHPELFAQGLYNGILAYFGFRSETPVAP